MKIEQLPEATESVEQQRLMQWARMESGKWPELALLYHVPNEGKRSRTAGARMKAEGLKKGVPDLCLPVARGGCHGLYIELKREKSGKATAAQIEWMEALMREGYAVSICHGWEAAAKTIRDYLETGETPQCCKSCYHHRDGKVQDCAVFRTTHGVKGGKCGMHSPI